ncbi:DUF3533 domain-containing protein [Streptomyces cavernae]|uniref:DUF3533 domain-containing protein n=1 Tax=Streptomyces cavernae TaxID=2259034 RepID=UPI000FEBA77F|nr:DUF3533 domain-containing protein [Streptomyces cavernae]
MTRTRRPLLTEVKDAVTARAALLVIGAIVLQLLFIASFVGALHDPEMRDVPFGIVTPRQVAPEAVARLEQLPGDPLEPRAIADLSAARQRILDREIDGALIIDARSTTDTLLVSSGGGTVSAEALQTLMETLARAERRTLRTVDVAPVSAADFDGLTSFHLVVGWCAGGCLYGAILAITPRRATIRLGALALVSVLGGLGGAVIVGPVLGALPGGVFALWGLGALVVFAAGATTLALRSVFGVAGIGLAILLVVIAGSASAGGAVPFPMLPPFWRGIGPALPPGAGTWAARSIAYFGGNGLRESLLVLSGWAVAGVSVTLLTASFRRRITP